MSSEPSGKLPLVTEIWNHICSFLPQPSLANLRLASARLNEIASPWMYHSIRLDADQESVEQFVNIAKSPRLRYLVREITIDTEIGSDYSYHSNQEYPFPIAFMNALPFLRCLTKLTALHLRFNEHCGEDDHGCITIEETWEFRNHVLDTICHCIAGMWTLERQLELDEGIKGCLDEEEFDYSHQDLEFPADTLRLKELTIANLAAYHDINTINSEAWRKVISLPSLVDFKTFVVSEQDEASPERAYYYEEKFEFFDSLHESWLSPSLSDHLKVLSLYCQDYWGWFPKMDFRLVGSDSPFPQLKVLALGNYVFSHDWQIEWFARIGKENGSGGLEELYLDDCPILFKARQFGPFDAENPGYPDQAVVLQNQDDEEKHRYPLRWHHFLSRWKDLMKGLKVFRMGSGAWNCAPNDTRETMMRSEDHAHTNQDKLYYRLSHNIHRYFACPPPIERELHPVYKTKIWASGRYLQGSGLSDDRASQMQYVKYDCGICPSAWEETKGHPGRTGEVFEPEEGTRVKDDAAYGALIAEIEAR
ncbi:hypothetical protein FSARC_8227 [Fusarium sarcochroum]|uniref:F-box domain-containing protein n=1 Tax=Fusarium sarcochroum TaxID=1208366 RepID=A0A8H4X6K2_9HYPO|nr:hypothetical protein FSARC_8227 [Fusarium sarcochroum]